MDVGDTRLEALNPRRLPMAEDLHRVMLLRLVPASYID